MHQITVIVNAHALSICATVNVGGGTFEQGLEMGEREPLVQKQLH